MPNPCDAPGLMPIEDARKIIQSIVASSQSLLINEPSQRCELNEALDRVLCEDIISPINVPAYDNSAMDGYALRFSDLANIKVLTQTGKSFAGNPFKKALEQGECVRIMTGAQIPSGADTVVMQENTRAEGDKITFIESVKQGSAIRPCGDDIAKDSVVLKKGRRITPIDIGLLASLGINDVPVYRRLKVAVFSTGDELLKPGEAARDDRIFDSNRPMLVAMLKRRGVHVIDMGIIADSKTLIKAAFESADAHADCVVTSGGVSVGEADYTREILEEYGSVDFWKLAIKPGKPLAFGRLNKSIFFGLPGNPVSSAVTFDQIAAPALDMMAGCGDASDTSLVAQAAGAFRKRPGRTDYQRAFYYVDDNGKLKVKQAGSQSSGVLSCFSDSNCYAVLENERGDVKADEQVTIMPFQAGIT
ncbi:gephyrin-like molybdotransferase Glp [Ningiella sp. W23]|uniref:molybdopterin molybdotransferase MoeA n=1 Tax=Ningiella sp. W23 TaxID=3023715 RepID=UPI0037568CB8